MTNEKDIDLIEKYSNNQLSDEEKKSFEMRIEGDSGLASTMEQFEISRAVIKANHRKRLISDAQAYLEQLEQKKKQPVLFISRRSITVAAALAVLIATVFILQININEHTPDQLFTQYYEIPSAPNIRSVNDEKNTAWKNSMTAYQSSQFEEAITLMVSLLESEESSLNARLQFYLGISLLQNEEIDRAITHFDEVSAQSSYAQQASWYKALAYLKLGDETNARKQLYELANDDSHYKQSDSQEMLTKF